MKRLFYSIIILFISINLVNAQKPEIVNSIVKVDKPYSYYVKQAELWWQEIEKNEKDEKAWYNYYRANRYARINFINCDTPECKKYSNWLDGSKYLKEAEEIMRLISKAIPNTYTYYISHKEGYPNSNERYTALQKAYEIEPDNPDTYDELIVYYETNNFLEKRIEFNNKWFRTNDIPSGILNYNYNILMSMRNGGTILTSGDNETFPMWMLQDVSGIRKDITVLNIHLLTIPEYREQIFKKLNIPIFSKEYPEGSTSVSQKEIVDHIIKTKPEEMPLYINASIWKQFQEYEKNLYLIGLVFEYSKDNIDNIALLKNNFENNYALDYIGNQFSYDQSQSVVNRTNANYLFAIIKLYQHYKLSGEKEKEEKIKKLGLLIADKCGDQWKNYFTEILK